MCPLNIDETNGIDSSQALCRYSQLWPPRQRAGCTENAVTSSVLARLSCSLACLKAKSSTAKCMYSISYETNGVIASRSLQQTHKFGRRDIEIALRKMQ